MPSRRNSIGLDEDQITRLASVSGINTSFPLSQGKPFEPFGDFEAGLKGVKGSKGFPADKGGHRDEILGMSIAGVLTIWDNWRRPPKRYQMILADLSTRLGLESTARLLLPEWGRGGVEGPK